MQKIKLHGKLKEALGDRDDLFLIGNLNDGGAIATKHQYENFTDSTAHLNRLGVVKRYGKVIGNTKDIEIVLN